MAYDRLEPISSPWQHTAATCDALWQAMTIIAAANGVELPERSAEDWIPDRATACSPSRASRRMSGDEVREIMERKFSQ